MVTVPVDDSAKNDGPIHFWFDGKRKKAPHRAALFSQYERLSVSLAEVALAVVSDKSAAAGIEAAVAV